MTSLHDLRFSPPPNSKSRLRLCIKPCALCNMHIRYRSLHLSIVGAPSRAVACCGLIIDQLLFKDIAVFMFKQNKNKNPSVFSKIFVINHSQYNTRNNSKIISKFCSTNVCQQSISHRGPSLWSKVPTSFKSQDLTIASFNLKMRNILCKDLIQV